MSNFQTQVKIDIARPAAAMPAVSVIRARDFEVTCPQCGHMAEGWVRDPRGTTDKCDKCGTEYRIPDNVEIKFA